MHGRPFGELRRAFVHALAQHLVLAVAAGQDRVGIPFLGAPGDVGVGVGGEAGLEAVEAAEAPFRGGDLADEDEFEDVFGEEVVFELLGRGGRSRRGLRRP